MVVVCATVFLGTVYPLIIEALTDNKISVGESYFNSTVIPIIMPAILIMGVGPILTWGENDKLKTLKKVIYPILITIILTSLIFLYYKSFSLVGFFGILLAFWIISNNLYTFFRNRGKNINSMIISHLGVGILILGITASSIWQKEKIVKMKIGNEVKIVNYNIIFENIKEIKKKNYLALKSNFLVFDEKNNIIAKLNPENRFYPTTNIFTTEVSIHTNFLRDLYIVLGEGNSNGEWVVKIYFNPLVIWIWIGALTIFLGGLFSINVNLKKLKNYND